MKLRLITLALVLASASAFAQDTFYDPARLYGQEDTLMLVSDGLYARVDANSEAYVATTPAGHHALLEKLLEIRANTPTVATRFGDMKPFAFDDLIETLSAPQPKNQDVFGDCNGPSPTNDPNSPMRVQALAGGGLGGSPYGASALTSNWSSPVINTTNRATAVVYDNNGNVLAQQTVTQSGATSAVATAYNTQRGCTAQSSAKITCPGHSSPSLTAIALNTRTYPDGSRCVIN